jgi:hypothetical protein
VTLRPRLTPGLPLSGRGLLMLGYCDIVVGREFLL